MSSKRLQGKRIAFLATNGFEQVELTRPWDALKEAGAVVELISPKMGKIQGMNHDEKADTFLVDKTVEETKAEKYDGLVLPGGVANPDALRTDEASVAFVRSFFDQSKPIAAICHGPWMLIEAGVVRDRMITSWPSLKTDLLNAGANWVDEEVVCDRGLVSSRNPNDLDAFCREAIEEFGRRPACQPAGMSQST